MELERQGDHYYRPPLGSITAWFTAIFPARRAVTAWKALTAM